jgi:flagellar hook-associated protein FlgK
MSRLKVQGYDSLVRDTKTNAIVNTSTSEYTIYMQRVKAREKQGDQIRNAVKEINNLKSELREIKELIIKGLGKK